MVIVGASVVVVVKVTVVGVAVMLVVVATMVAAAVAPRHQGSASLREAPTYVRTDVSIRSREAPRPTL